MRTFAELSRLSGRKVFITGATGHIGRAATDVLVELGAHVAVSDRDAKVCAKRVEELNSRTRGSGAIAAVCDLSNERKLRQAVDRATAQMKGLDVLVHCAAYMGSTRISGWAVPFEKQTVAAWDKALRVNLTAAFVMAQQAHQALAVSGHGSVILISSIYGVVGPDFTLYANTPMANPLGYGASKGGVLQLMRYLSTLLAPRVRVNAISPGGILRGQPHAFQERYVQRTPLKRMGHEEDLKGAVAYLASDLSQYVTGHNLMVDGGWTAW